MNKKLLFSILVVIAVVVLVMGIKYYWDRSNMPTPVGTPTPTGSASPSPTPSTSPSPTVSAKPGDVPTNRLVPKCNLSGQVVYDGGAFVHAEGQEFNYKDANDPTDMIKWTVAPAGENFSIGPNRMSGLKRGSGGDYLTVSFDGITPKYSEYILSASIDYVGLVNNEAKILNQKCTGQTILKINK